MADAKRDTGEKLIATNPTARSAFAIEELVEAGLVLTGTEVKSIRVQAPALKDAWVEVSSHHGGALEAWLVGANIPHYVQGNIWNHEPDRKRKLLLHSHQIARIFGAITREGRTAIPTRLYFKKGRIKIEIAVAKGKKTHDRRREVEKRGADREMARAMRRSRKE